jgi:hypothetical protein
LDRGNWVEKAPIARITVESVHHGMNDQSDYAIFVRSDLAGEYISMTDKIWDYSLKFQEPEVSQ